MSKKKSEKRAAFLESQFKDVLVCKDKKTRPYLEIFVQEPENVFQQNLGTLFGVLEITENSEDSSYIVNYLISIIKKEFFSQVKRGSIESFEAALHKANLALAKLAEHGQISWIGHLNAACAVIEKNNVHLSQSGTASAYLLRSKVLVNIGEPEPGEEDPNPLKTFQEVLSGRLEDGDKLILTTDEIFEIFSLEEIKRSGIKFSKSQFVQFLHTALINELEKAAVLVVDMEEKEELEASSSNKKAKAVNAFSQEAFSRKTDKNAYEEMEEKKQRAITELKEELKEYNDDFSESPNGHLYIKDDGYIKEKPGMPSSFLKDSWENISYHTGNLSGALRQKARSNVQNLRSKLSRKSPTGEAPAESIRNEETAARITWKERLAPAMKNVAQLAGATAVNAAKFASVVSFYTKSFAINRIFLPLRKASQTGIAKTRTKLEERREAAAVRRQEKEAEKREALRQETNRRAEEELWKSKEAYQKPAPATSQQIQKEPEITRPLRSEEPEQGQLQETNYAENPQIMAPSREEKRQWFNALSKNSQTMTYPAPKTSPIETKVMPDFEKLRGIFSSLDYTKRVYLLIIIILLFIVPYFIVKIQDKWQSREIQTTASAEDSPIAPSENDKDATRISTMNNVYQGNHIQNIINVNGKIFAVENDKITSLGDNKSYSLPQDFLNPDRAAEMDDLNIIFIMKDNRVLSFFANTGKFQNNKISIPDTVSAPMIKSYLTYLYVLSPADNQIYRYPRAEGGFGDKTDWIKGDADLSGFKSMAISGDVFVTDGKDIEKFTKGKKQDYSLEKTTTSLSIDELYAKPDSTNLFILDKTNARILEVDASGKIIAQYHHPDIAHAQDFVVNEKDKTAYITTETQVENFSIN